MNKKKLGIVVLSFFLIFFSVYRITTACIGKTITIGYKNFVEQKILAEILYSIITERTGTTVVLKSFSSTEECNKALEKNEISLYVEYVGMAYSEILHENDNSKSYDAIIGIVKNNYSEKKNLVWLNLFKFESSAGENDILRKKGLPLTSGPVIGKETLKMFPILPRLLNKLGDKIDNISINELIKLVVQKKIEPKIAAQNFLKIKKLI
ncbi:hypothetical protein HZA55_01320 [Candidatus Poribacteria bacterium]|nr:hypothetical protein [Candidatus Poribacteria bacterium]